MSCIRLFLTLQGPCNCSSQVRRMCKNDEDVFIVNKQWTVVDATPDVETCAVDGEFDDVLVAAVEKNSGSPVQKVAVVADIAENVSEDVAEIPNEVAGIAEEVEPVFYSLELFGPEVEKPNFKIEEVIAPDFDLSVAESAEAFVLHVAREISNANPPNDTLDEIENAFEKTLDAKMKDAGVYKGKVVLLRNASGSGASGYIHCFFEVDLPVGC
ncbi:hypothetical protein POM88_041400 [Heracleum sosnowskyi]|uniref:Uncharacterized protein n=1 Tax=Heracleum sosnowskyi TaxID=360622 RepID=A0AAD8MAQ9_9APIA|nr:hypothetical protein POM88_041400 [Heracleum sosnowskyi]